MTSASVRGLASLSSLHPWKTALAFSTTAVTGVPLWPSATTCVATPSIHPPVPAR